MKEIIALIIVVLILGAILWFAIDKYEETECKRWQKQATEFEGYYFTNWQIEQCEAHDIELKL